MWPAHSHRNVVQFWLLLQKMWPIPFANIEHLPKTDHSHRYPWPISPTPSKRWPKLFTPTKRLSNSDCSCTTFDQSQSLTSNIWPNLTIPIGTLDQSHAIPQKGGSGQFQLLLHKVWPIPVAHIECLTKSDHSCRYSWPVLPTPSENVTKPVHSHRKVVQFWLLQQKVRPIPLTHIESLTNLSPSHKSPWPILPTPANILWSIPPATIGTLDQSHHYYRKFDQSQPFSQTLLSNSTHRKSDKSNLLLQILLKVFVRSFPIYFLTKIVGSKYKQNKSFNCSNTDQNKAVTEGEWVNVVTTYYNPFINMAFPCLARFISDLMLLQLFAGSHRILVRIHTSSLI